MSNAVLDLASYPGLSWGTTRSPQWSTSVKTSVSGREYRAANESYPRWVYKAGFEVLRARAAFPEMQALAAFYNARNAGADDFLFNDPDDRAVTAQLFGTGNGSQTQFQLTRPFGGYVEPVFALNGTPSIFKSAVLQATPAAYSINSAGLVTFTAAPAAAAPLTWTGNYYWRCRFLKDNLDFTQFMRMFWALRALEFITVKP